MVSRFTDEIPGIVGISYIDIGNLGNNSLNLP